MLITMPLPCICDPCFALHMMIDSSTCMCICKLGGDIACCCRVPLVDSTSMLHLRATSLHDMTPMLAYVASPMIHTCSIHAVDGIHFHDLHMIAISCCHMSPYVASFMLDALSSIECNNDFNIANEIAPIAFSHIFGDFDRILVKHACL